MRGTERLVVSFVLGLVTLPRFIGNCELEFSGRFWHTPLG